MMRFLRYSLEKEKKIRVMLDDGESITQMNLTVTALNAEYFSFISARKKQGATLPLSAVLSAGYARGDKEQG